MVAERFPEVRYVAEAAEGLDFARNLALREARYPVVAFLDDDAVADQGWGARITAHFRDGEVAACTGRVEPLSVDTAARRLFEANGGYGRGNRRIVLPDDSHRPLRGLPAPLIAWAVSVGNGCSMAVRRNLALGMGGFDEALDLGNVLPGGGDLDMLWRFLDAGHRIIYEPDALAHHEHRREMDAVVRQIVGHQRALVAFLVKTLRSLRGRKRLPVLAFLVWRLGKPGARALRRLLNLDPLPLPVLLRMWTHTWRGLGAYRVGLRVAEKRGAVGRVRRHTRRVLRHGHPAPTAVGSGSAAR
jgi:GT2 family glycosyltransferase